MRYGDSGITWVSLLAENPDKVNEFVTCFPVLDSVMDVKAKIIGVEEWSNHIEATITCELDDGFVVSFFATDYAWNKGKYAVGLSLYVSLAALAYSVDEAEKGFSFEGQQAFDFLVKIGKQPTYDANGAVEPVHFSTEQLVAFIQSNEDCPEDYEFQSPIFCVKQCRTLGVEMASCSIAIKRDPDIIIPVYFKSSIQLSPYIDMPLRGLLWLQGKISGTQIKEPVDTRVLGEVGWNYTSTIHDKYTSGELDSFVNLNWILDILDQVKLDKAFDLDAFEVGNSYGARLRLYVCDANSQIEYIPGSETYNDSMYVARMLDDKQADQIPEIWRYLKIPFTPIGIWQAYLLKCADKLLPKKWHGCYNSRDYIFFTSDLESLYENKGHLFSDDERRKLLEYRNNGELLPHVDIADNNAVVSFSYWNS